MLLNRNTYCVLLLLLFSLSEIKAQVCNGTLGDPIIGAGTDFGRGATRFSPAIGETNYNYIAGTPDDGQYTIVKTTAGLNSGWHQNVVNHTPNDPDGYFMVVNAGLTKGIFYEKVINNLCPNTTYEFAAYIINILRNPGIKPNIKFTIISDGTPTEATTNDIPEGNAADWIKYGTTFTTSANVGSITLRMTNENPGGIGNDLAIDDITFRACGPSIIPTFTNVNVVANDVGNICIGDTRTVLINATFSGGYTNPEYKWQEYNGSTWVNSAWPGADTKQLTVDFNNATVGDYKYQVIVSGNGNINNPTCRVISQTISIVVNPNPNPIASNDGATCIGGDINLHVSDGVAFKWTGPNGYESTERDPVIKNANADHAGIYHVIAYNAGGCGIEKETTVEISPAVNGTINVSTTEICVGESQQLLAGGGLTYAWSPTEGLSDPAIANPMASPTQTTIYTVTISNGQCSVTKAATVKVLKSPNANAGTDKTTLAGQPISLNGAAIGDKAVHHWTPTDYLDDPTKLNPIANPPINMIYTLHVESECGSATDDVFVKVYPKVEIPNAFTPNGDGINDTWTIPSIVNFEKPRMVVVNRYGQVVFEGTKNPVWDGKLNGKEVPSGIYYYTLFLNNEFKLYSGWVLITR